MRPIHPLEVAAAILVIVPNVVFSLACVPPGCGSHEEPDAPGAVGVEAHPPGWVTSASTTFPSTLDAGTAPADSGDPGAGGTGGTGDTGVALPPEDPVPCGGEDPSLALLGGDGAPLPDEIEIVYGEKVQNCSGGGPPGAYVRVAPDGLLPGTVEVAYTVTVDGERADGSATWGLACLPDGLASGTLQVGLPKSADGETVKLEVTVTDAAGTAVSASTGFVARVSQH